MHVWKVQLFLERGTHGRKANSWDCLRFAFVRKDDSEVIARNALILVQLRLDKITNINSHLNLKTH